MSYLVGIDLGSSGAKAGIFDADGTLRGSAQQEYRFEHPQPAWSEIDPRVVWEAACQCLRAARSRANIDADEIRGIGLAMIGETVMALDDKGDAIYPAIEAVDGRDGGYAPQIQEWQERVGAERIFEITSYPLSSLASANKVMWLRENRREVRQNLRHAATFQDYALRQLTGEFAIDYSMASRTMLFDVAAKKWSPELLAVAGIAPEQLSRPFPAHTVVGGLSAAAAEATGLHRGIPVVAGAHDQACAALGVGALSEGTAMDGSGSVEAVVVPSAHPISDPAMMRLGQGTQCGVTGEIYLALGFHLSSGSLIRWFRDQMAFREQAQADQTGQDVYDLITQAAASSPPGANGLMMLPHTLGSGTGAAPPLNPLSRGTLVGLSLAHTHADLARAFFEGVTLETRVILDSLESSGIAIRELRVTGGGAKSPFWLQLKADILRKRIVVPAVTEASLLGAAMLAGVGAGTYSSLPDAVAQAVRLSSVYEPDKARADLYDRLFQVYRRIYPTQLALFDALHRFVSETREQSF
ncbi:MAG: hypothetical protein IT331_01520 [Anaerolineae bacterium]|nr:hypothetical protein [Anaerolineae bacterium]